jgi:hypothetical protein
MSKLTAKQVTAAIVVAQNREGLASHERYVRDYPQYEDRGYEDIEDPDWGEIGSSLDTSVGEVKLIEDVGGEGQGDHAHVVIQTVATGQFFRINGYYSSYDGTDWYDSELHEVQPVTKTVVVYE